MAPIIPPEAETEASGLLLSHPFCDKTCKMDGARGASFGLPLLRLAGVRDDRAIGAAIGAASHGVGTASLVRRSEMQASASSWAMAAAGIFTSLLAALIKMFLH